MCLSKGGITVTSQGPWTAAQVTHTSSTGLQRNKVVCAHRTCMENAASSKATGTPSFFALFFLLLNND
jgi:hypothetical protein